MKIKLIDAGYEKFSGHFGTVLFEDGVSVNDVSDEQARFFASILGVRCVDDESDPGSNAQFQRALRMEAQSVTYQTQAEADAQEKALNPVEEKVAEATSAHTREALEAIADKGGIKALREIGDKLDVRGSDIKKLINAILNAESKAPASEVAQLTEEQ